MLFVDMLRPNRFGSFNDEIGTNQIDELFKDLGGTFYTNCFSPAPDTPRSMACLYSGLLPKDNGCDTRLKWPGKFMYKDIPTIFDPFINSNYKMNFFSDPVERFGGLFPPGIEKIGNHNQDYNLDQYLEQIELAEDHFIFIGIDDYHWALNDWSYTRKGERAAITETRRTLDVVFDHFDKDQFDHLFLFSDHGFKFASQLTYEPEYKFLNRDRANILMFHRKRGSVGLSYENKLCSIQDIEQTIKEIFGFESSNSLLNGSERPYVVIEDHYSISTPKVNQDIDIWALVKKNEMYVRTLKEGFLIQDGQIVHDKIIKEYDVILEAETQFGKYHNEYKKIFTYPELNIAQNVYMNGNSRVAERRYQNILRWMEKQKDKLLFKTGGGF